MGKHIGRLYWSVSDPAKRQNKAEGFLTTSLSLGYNQTFTGAETLGRNGGHFSPKISDVGCLQKDGLLMLLLSKANRERDRQRGRQDRGRGSSKREVRHWRQTGLGVVGGGTGMTQFREGSQDPGRERWHREDSQEMVGTRIRPWAQEHHLG